MTRLFDPLFHMIEVLAHELATLRMSGPRFLIKRRFHMPGTIHCTPGEETVDIALVHRRRNESIGFSTIQRFLFDYLARHTLPQTAEQVSLGMKADRFIQMQGAYAKIKPGFKRTISRAAVKLNISRMRECLGRTFARVGCNYDPRRVLVSNPTEGNEVRYQLRASIGWMDLETAA